MMHPAFWKSLGRTFELIRPCGWVAAALMLCAAVGEAPADTATRLTVLPESTLVGLANTVSGARPLEVLTRIAGTERLREPKEYTDAFLEAEVIAAKAREYGLSGVEILKYPAEDALQSGRRAGQNWVAHQGELWVTSPVLRKIVDVKDMAPALAPGSVSGTYEGELVWVENSADANSYGSTDVRGAIVLTNNVSKAGFDEALKRGALGVIRMTTRRPYVVPDAVQWQEIGTPEQGFAFNISAPMAAGLRAQQAKGAVRIKTVVAAEWQPITNQVVTAVIPGDGSTEEWVYFSGHLFEGINKQGAHDDGSGSVLILEAARTLVEAIEKGYLRRPARSIRLIWVDEIVGTEAFLERHPAERAKVVADINIDMAGQNMTLHGNSLQLFRMPDAHIHYVADVAQAFLEWTRLSNYERMDTGEGYQTVPLEDPMGSRDGFAYTVETYIGGSDHVSYLEHGIPAVFFHTWPDPVYHSSHDRPERMDATQMKRIAFIVAATGAVVAGTPEVSPVAVALEVQAYGRARTAEVERRWSHWLEAAEPQERPARFRDYQAAQRHWVERERRALRTVLELTRGSTSREAKVDARVINALVSELKMPESRSAELLYQRLTGQSPPHLAQTREEAAADRLIPAARVVLQSMGKVLPAPPEGLSGFMPDAVRFAIDGRRSALAIWQMVNGELGGHRRQVPLSAVVTYLRSLESAGKVRITAAQT